ncbi:MAG: recombinase family protein [Chloroflexota bacterium]
MSDRRIAAIWARVSTEEQQSLDYQVADVKGWLESQGYEVPEGWVLKVHWTSLATLDCPEMQTLLSWVRNEDIDAIGIWHTDRLTGRPAHKVYILDLCQRNNVTVLSKTSPLIEGREGELLEYIQAWGKEGQVLYAQEGSKGKLHDRAKRLGLPATCQPPYGYRWSDTRRELLPTPQWENRCTIVRLYLEGGTVYRIKRELHERTIPSPKGREWWPEPTIWGILVDSVNCGEYTALRRQSIEPQTRRGKRNGQRTYGKTSSKRVQGMPLTNIEVKSPVCTRDEQAWINRRLGQNRLNSRRNAKHDYLLRGWIKYEADGRTYACRYIRDGNWSYEYPDNGFYAKDHPCPYINGPWLEGVVEERAKELLTNRAVLENELGRSEQAISESMANLEREKRSLEQRKNSNANAEVQLLLDRSQHTEQISDEAFQRALTRIHTERAHIDERLREVTAQMEDLGHSASSLAGLSQLREQLEQRLASTEFADRRFVLEALGTEVRVTPEGRIEVEFTIPREIPKEKIALSRPGNGVNKAHNA